VIDERVGADVARPALHEAALVARCEVMQFEDAKQILTDLDQIPFSQTRCLN
jgi:hypothetical protein